MKVKPNQQDPPPLRSLLTSRILQTATSVFSFSLPFTASLIYALCCLTILTLLAHQRLSAVWLAVCLSVWLVASPASAKEKLRRLKCGNFHFFAIIKFIFKLPLAVEAERAERPRPRRRRRLTLHYFPYTTLHFSFSLQS